MNKILYLEDDLLFGESVVDFLEEGGFCVELVKSVDEAIEVSYKSRFDLYVFDINLPDGSGLELLDDLKKSGDDTPCLYLTSYKDQKTLLHGFKAGCDDYIKKPCDPDELLVRIKAVLKRSGKLDGTKHFYGFDIDSSAGLIYKNGEILNIPKKLYSLIDLFHEKHLSIVTQDMIVSRLWDIDEEPSLGALRVYINKLNKLLVGAKITNIKGVGYKLI